MSAPTTIAPTGSQAGDTIGTGPVKVALILPLTQGAGPSAVGVSLRNAAELALSEAGSTDITLLVKDDHSTPDGGEKRPRRRRWPRAPISCSARCSLATSRPRGKSRAPAGKPVIAYSTDLSAASRGVYLLSFLVEGYVDRIIEYAASQGKKSLAVLAPENDYATVAIGALQQAAARRDMRVVLIERYKPAPFPPPPPISRRLAARLTLFSFPNRPPPCLRSQRPLPPTGSIPSMCRSSAPACGTIPGCLSLPALQGAWFAAPENAGFTAFAQRYRAKFGSDPTRVATLAYDSVSLAAALARTQGRAPLQRGSPDQLHRLQRRRRRIPLQARRRQ